MRIEEYFEQTQDQIAACPVIILARISFDKRGTHIGYIYGELRCIDNSILQIREFVDVESQVVQLMYAYQYMDTKNNLVFRYDNAGHHRKLDLPTYPHHKHQGDEKNVLPAKMPELKEILEEIQSLVNITKT